MLQIKHKNRSKLLDVNHIISVNDNTVVINLNIFFWHFFCVCDQFFSP